MCESSEPESEQLIRQAAIIYHSRPQSCRCWAAAFVASCDAVLHSDHTMDSVRDEIVTCMGGMYPFVGIQIPISYQLAYFYHHHQE